MAPGVTDAGLLHPFTLLSSNLGAETKKCQLEEAVCVYHSILGRLASWFLNHRQLGTIPYRAFIPRELVNQGISPLCSGELATSTALDFMCWS